MRPKKYLRGGPEGVKVFISGLMERISKRLVMCVSVCVCLCVCVVCVPMCVCVGVFYK